MRDAKLRPLVYSILLRLALFLINVMIVGNVSKIQHVAFSNGLRHDNSQILSSAFDDDL
jgi:hypothetical protein